MGLISQLPGGLGVFETVVILLTTPVLPAHKVVGSSFGLQRRLLLSCPYW